MIEKYYIEVDYIDCCGCKLCEQACGVVRGEGVVSPGTARIRVEVRPTLGVDMPLICQHCEDPPCNVCPHGAMSINNMGVVLIDAEKCIGCKQCVDMCPFGAIQIHPVTRKAIKCDLCGGKPKCVEVCQKAHPPGVLRYVKVSNAGKYSRDRWADRLEKQIIAAMQSTEVSRLEKHAVAAKDLKMAAEKGDVA
jgi:carbon-monoxide dehydrogenase iron sulfur subunit